MVSQIIVNGLLSGLVYVIMALGFTLVFGIMRIVNFAHGEFYMAGAMIVVLLYKFMAWPFFVAVAVGGLGAALLGVIIERFLIRPLVSEEMPGMIMTLAVGITLQSAALLLVGPAEQTIARPFAGTWILLGAAVPWDRTVVAICALVILAGFYAFMKCTRLGLAMQAVAQDRETASLMGIESTRIYAVAFGMSCLFAGLAGALMAPIYPVGPYMGEAVIVRAFVIVILGGLGSVPGAVLGGMLIGLIESAVATTVNPTTALISSFGMVLVIIIFRPTGLMGRAVR